MTDNVFLKEAKDYTRDISPIPTYMEQTSFYLSKMSGKDIEVCKKLAMSQLSKDAQTVDPIVTFHRRDEYGDKAMDTSTLSSYIRETIANNELLAPTMTTYINASKRKSFLVDFIDSNVKNRSRAKKEAFKAEAEGKKDLFINKNNEQANLKTYNNSLSGAFATDSSVLFNPSAHSTLTSTIRTVSSLGNSSNEKVVSGNRHYFNPDVTLYNIISLASSTDREAIDYLVNEGQLVYPTVQDTIDCIKYSSDLYWRREQDFSVITAFIEKLDPVERASVVYTGDLYHVRKYNDKFVRDLVTKLGTKVTGQTVEDPITYIRSSDEQIVNFAHLVCMKEVRGKGKDYEKMPIEDVQTLACTIRNISSTLVANRKFIETIFLTNNVPCSTAHIRSMLRRTVVLSDTDSTMFSVDEWVEWYYGELIFTDEAYGISAVIMFLATQAISHLLAIFSTNINVSEDKLTTLAMKPEFAFAVFFQSSVSKHYFTSTDVKEGNVFDVSKIEIKGVHLKNSAAPRTIVKQAHERMQFLIDKIKANEKISLTEELAYVANLEKEITDSLHRGETTYFKLSKVKLPEAYSNEPERSPYVHHMFWLTVLAPKYGHIEEPPYSVIKIPTTLNNKTSLARWVSSIEDKDLASRLQGYLVKLNKTSLPTIYISIEYAQAFGVPEEIKPIIDTKRIILDLSNINRMILESIGYFPKTGWLVSELLQH